MTKTDAVPTHAENRQWLKDRASGKSKYDDSRPFCGICWVPPPVTWCPSVLEENAFCRWWGKIGFMSKRKVRFNVLLVGFVANLIGFVLTIYACFAISEDFDTLRRTGFSSGSIELNDSPASEPVSVDIGLTAIAFDNPNTGVRRLVKFDEVCDIAVTGDNELARIVYADQCDTCSDVSGSMVSSVIIAVVTFIPSFATDILRMYEHYDVNCQKGFATIFATITLLLSFNTLAQYSVNCFDTWYDGTVAFDVDDNVVRPDSPAAAYSIDLDWQAGPGLIALSVGTSLKFIDILCNLFIAAPTIARDVYEKAEYEKLGEKERAAGEAEDSQEEIGSANA